MKKVYLSLLLITLMLFLTSCEQLTSKVEPQLVSIEGSPVAVDLIPDADGKLKEEVLPVLTIKAVEDKSTDRSGLMSDNKLPGITLTYCSISFSYVGNLYQTPIPDYIIPITHYIEAGSSKPITLTFYDDDQSIVLKSVLDQRALNNELFQQVDVNCRAVFYGYDSYDNNFTYEVNFIAQFGNWAT